MKVSKSFCFKSTSSNFWCKHLLYSIGIGFEN